VYLGGGREALPLLPIKRQAIPCATLFRSEDELTILHYPATFWAAAIIAVLLIGIAKAGFAGGVGTLATPLVALTISVAEAAALLLPLLIITDVLALFYYRRDFDRKSIKVLLPGALVGIFVGSLFFRSFTGKDDVLRLGVGILALLFVAFQAGRDFIFGKITRHAPGAAEGVVMGAVTGFTSTISHSGGPPLAIYLLPQRFPKHIYVGTTAVFFALTNSLKLIPYAALGLLKPSSAGTVLALAPFCLIGVKMGVYLNRTFNEVWFMRLVYSVLFLSGIQLIWTGIAGM
jgi:uncharacterized membrane protein YfcA